MRSFTNNPSPAYKKAVAVLKKLAEDEGTDSAHRAYAEAVWEQCKKQYISKHGLKPSGGHPCVSRLIGRRCSALPGGGSSPCHIPGWDHVSLWLKDGKPEVYVSQPYSLSLNEMRNLVRFCDEYGLTVSVSTWPAWHFPGGVLTMEVRKANR
ncbi:MAG: hypothetical protein A4E53_04661 [Pelotomaculum sp. PtaB.Bin104]|nr:MAG: hypothetical protein A4E53_04661 [Pelotomaculum sp. PtaB.Bin104]